MGEASFVGLECGQCGGSGLGYQNSGVQQYTVAYTETAVVKGRAVFACSAAYVVHEGGSDSGENGEIL